MKKVLMIRRNPVGVNDGTANYCKALYEMYAHDDRVSVLPIENYPTIHSRLFKYRYTSSLRQAIAEADIIHINGYTAMGTRQAMKWAHELGKKVVYTAHWHPFSCLRHPLLGKAFFDVFLRSTIRRCVDTVVAINDEDYRFFSAFHPRVVKIPHWYKQADIAAGLPRQPRMLLFVGRVDDPVKGVEHLLALPEGKYDIHCVGNGQLAERSDITRHINISDQELSELYQQAAVVVVPSKYEAFSYVALEALMHHTPVVLSDRVRIADHLAGIAGSHVFSYGDKADFSSKIEEAIGSSVDIEAIKEIFSPTRIKQCYDNLYLS